jgi:hypothetical protein
MSNTTASSQPIRGSQKLLEHLRKNGETPSVEEIKKAIAMPAKVDYKVLQWLIRGIPPAYLELDATLQVSAAHVGDLVSHFVALNDSAIGLAVFTKGIPIPEIATVRIRNVPGEE